jgi:hypothetical protein
MDRLGDHVLGVLAGRHTRPRHPEQPLALCPGGVPARLLPHAPPCKPGIGLHRSDARGGAWLRQESRDRPSGLARLRGPYGTVAGSPLDPLRLRTPQCPGRGQGVLRSNWVVQAIRTSATGRAGWSCWSRRWRPGERSRLPGFARYQVVPRTTPTLVPSPSSSPLSSLHPYVLVAGFAVGRATPYVRRLLLFCARELSTGSRRVRSPAERPDRSHLCPRSSAGSVAQGTKTSTASSSTGSWAVYGLTARG